MPDLRTIPDVELARVGTYDLSTGPHEFTRGDLAALIRNAQTGSKPRIKIGHVDPRFDGEPAIGVVGNVRAAEDGDVAIGDLINVPAWLADALPSSWPGRSIEASNHPDTGLRLTALALLGQTRPGIDSLADLEYALAAAARQDPSDPAVPYVAVAANQLRASEPVNPAPSGPDTPKEVHMDPKQIRAKLGLAEDASEEDVMAALDTLTAPPELVAETEPLTEEPVVAEPAPEPVAEVTADDPIIAEFKRQLDEATTEIAALNAEKAERVAIAASAAREHDVDTAIREGRIAPVERDHYVALHEISPDRTRELLAARARGSAAPVLAASGATPSPSITSDEDALLAASRARMGHKES